MGYLNLLLGAEGVGKGVLMAWVTARLTRGELPGDLYGRPVGVAIFADEDSFDDVWTPRLKAAGADFSRVLQVERPDGGFVHIGEDRPALVRLARRERISVLFFDQLLDHLGADVDDWRQKAVRDALQPLRALARDLDAAAIGALHPNKRGANFRQLVSGSGAFNAVSRSSLLLAEDPDEPDIRLLVRGKGNHSAPPSPLAFDIASRRLNVDGRRFVVPRAVRFRRASLDVDDLLTAFAQPRMPDHSKVGGAKAAIARALPHDGGWHDAGPTIAACGVDAKTAQRARRALGIEVRKKPGAFPATTQWRWPAQRTADRTSAHSVQRVHSVHSGSPRTPDTPDTGDSAGTSPVRVRSGTKRAAKRRNT